jgi:hypothetical protein
MLLLTVDCVLMLFFWVKTPCGLVGRSQRFGQASYLHLQGSASALKMETAHMSETLASTNQSTRHLNPPPPQMKFITVMKTLNFTDCVPSATLLLQLMFVSNWRLLAACDSLHQQWCTPLYLISGAVIWVFNVHTMCIRLNIFLKRLVLLKCFLIVRGDQEARS